jgi:hypothetical protein
MRAMHEPLARTARLTRLVWRAARAYDASPWAVWQRAVLVRRGYGFRMDEAVPLGLLDPAFPESRFRELVPFGRLNALQRRLSPPALTAIIDDKILFWLTCRAHGLPTPPVRAIIRRSRSGWTEDGATPLGRDEWAEAFAPLADSEVVAKPARGDRGEGVRAFEVHGGRFYEDGRPLGDGGDFYASVVGDRRYDEFVVQDRLANHDLIARLSGSRTLQTLRIWTLVEAKGDVTPDRVAVLGGKLKFAATDAAADNPLGGPEPSGFSLIDADTGTLGPLVRMRPDGLGQEVLERHPRTGAVYEGVRVPGWQEAVGLAGRAAAAFSPLRTLGWDVALTPDGPVLVEANAGWGPSNELGIAPRLLRRLEDALRAEPPRDGLAGAVASTGAASGGAGKGDS